MTDSPIPLKRTPLYDLHVELGGRMVPYAGYEMPVQYPAGILKEHLQTRAAASLFDVSHMGQTWLDGADAIAVMEELTAADLKALAPGEQRYTQLLNAQGGIFDDLIITRPADGGDRLYMVVNAARKAEDYALIREHAAGRAELRPLEDHALLAIQGPQAVAAVAALFGDAVRTQSFMTQHGGVWNGVACLVSRSGYTGEDGFEISVPAAAAADLARALLAAPGCGPAGLGARDSLRLEAGLCLYGQDIDAGTTPVEAGLVWSIGKRRRQEGGFPGADVIMAQLRDGPARRRVGLLPEGRVPARSGAAILDSDGTEIGMVTSGGFGPSLEAPVAMGYVPAALAAPGSAVQLAVRDKRIPAKVVKMPLVPQNYYRG